VSGVACVFFKSKFKKEFGFFKFLLPPTRFINEFPSKYITCHLVLLPYPAVRNHYLWKAERLGVASLFFKIKY